MGRLFERGYLTFYPAKAAIVQKLATIVGYLQAPDLPKRLRRAGVRSGCAVETWVIEDASGEVVKRELSDQERQLPIAAIWNHEFLVQRVSEGWRPEFE